MEFSARLVLNSNSRYSKNRVSFFQSVSPYWQALLSALEGNAIDCAASLATDLIREGPRKRHEVRQRLRAHNEFFSYAQRYGIKCLLPVFACLRAGPFMCLLSL
jgi:hypothetical protein